MARASYTACMAITMPERSQMAVSAYRAEPEASVRPSMRSIAPEL